MTPEVDGIVDGYEHQLATLEWMKIKDIYFILRSYSKRVGVDGASCLELLRSFYFGK